MYSIESKNWDGISEVPIVDENLQSNITLNNIYEKIFISDDYAKGEDVEDASRIILKSDVKDCEISSSYSKAFKEVYDILNCIPKSDFNKIPNNLISVIMNNMDLNYELVITKNFQNIKLLKESTAILAIIYRDYWATKNEREIIIAQFKYDIYLKEKEKLERCAFLTNNPESIIRQEFNGTKLIEYKVSLFKRVLNKIKLILNKVKESLS